MAVITTLTKEQKERLDSEHMTEISGIGIKQEREINNEDLMNMIAQINNQDIPDNQEKEPEPDTEEVSTTETKTSSEYPDEDYNYDDEIYEDLDESYEPEYEEPEYEEESEMHTPDIAEKEEIKPQIQNKIRHAASSPVEKIHNKNSEPYVVKASDKNRIITGLLYFGIYNLTAWIIAAVLYFIL